ncbi:hypothetical protein FO519_006931 [Halicephalobus sp. NKZ332]|nr:hypothetical protein FO519_006931 [Halicephalobus sp. NKZ332]
MKVEEYWKTKIFLQFVVIVCLIYTTGVNWWLKKEIDDLNEKLVNCEIGQLNLYGSRPKRDIQVELNQNDGTYFLPLYTQLTPKNLKHLCANRYDLPEFEESEKLENFENNEFMIFPAPESPKISYENKNSQKEKNRTKVKPRRKQKLRKLHQKKKCQKISGFSDPVNYGSRLYEIGSAVRLGHSIFVTEYAMGYMLFEYNVTENFKNPKDPNNLKSSENPEDSEDLKNIKNTKNPEDRENLLKVPSNIFTLPMPFSGTDHAIGELPDKSRIFFYQVSSTNSILGYNLDSGKSVQKEIPDLGKDPVFRNSNSFIDLENVQYDQKSDSLTSFDNGQIYSVTVMRSL